MFLVVGVWILVDHKRQFEKGAIISSIDIDKYRPLYDDKKKAAFQLWEGPKNIEKHLAYLKQEQKIMEYAKTLNSLQNQELNHGKIVYLNDIWLGMFFTAIYLLLFPLYEMLATQYIHPYVPLGVLTYWLPLASFIVFVVLDARKSRPYIEQAINSKRVKIDSETKHTNGYSERIQSEIDYVKKMMN